MALTEFGFAQLVLRLERERSFEACVKVAEALGWSLVEKSGSFELNNPDSRLLDVYFHPDALVDDVLKWGRLALGWD
jgi:hypothetical protein